MDDRAALFPLLTHPLFTETKKIVLKTSSVIDNCKSELLTFRLPKKVSVFLNYFSGVSYFVIAALRN